MGFVRLGLGDGRSQAGDSVKVAYGGWRDEKSGAPTIFSARRMGCKYRSLFINIAGM